MPVTKEELTEAYLDARTQETADEWAGVWAQDWGRVLAKFGAKIGRPETECLQILSGLGIVQQTQAYLGRLETARAQDVKFDRHLREVRETNAASREANQLLIEALRRVEPVLKRLALPWWKRLFV